MKAFMKENVHIVESDILIIGSGIAGLSAALAASKDGKKVLVKRPIRR